LPTAQSVPNTVMTGVVTRKIDPVKMCRSFLGGGFRISWGEELREPVDDIHALFHGRKHNLSLLPREVRREWCNAIDEVLRNITELLDGILDVPENGDSAFHSVKVFTRIHPGLGAVGHTGDLVFFRMPYQSVGDLAIEFSQLTFAVYKCPLS